jgi:hypothetical protein
MGQEQEKDTTEQITGPFFRGIKYSKVKMPKEFLGSAPTEEALVMPKIKVMNPKQIEKLFDVGPEYGSSVGTKVGDVSLITKRGKYGKKTKKSPKKEDQHCTGKFYGL